MTRQELIAHGYLDETGRDLTVDEERRDLTLEDIETYGEGTWVKCNLSSNYVIERENYEKYREDGSKLVKTNDYSFLKNTDWYLFVDNDQKIQIMIRISSDYETPEYKYMAHIYRDARQKSPYKAIYTDVLLSFLEKNAVERDKWLLKQERWIKRLLDYTKKIDNKTFSKDDVPRLFRDFSGIDYYYLERI